jgi:hypothetical protein
MGYNARLWDLAEEVLSEEELRRLRYEIFVTRPRFPAGASSRR